MTLKAQGSFANKAFMGYGLLVLVVYFTVAYFLCALDIKQMRVTIAVFGQYAKMSSRGI